MTKLIIFRHGETDANKLGICTNEDFPLNATGVMQAEKLRNELSKENIEVLLSSPLKRTLETAKIVSNSMCYQLSELVEVSTGDVEGMSYDSFFERNISIFGRVIDCSDVGFMDSQVLGGESRNDILVRWNKVINYIKNNHSDKKVIGVATHYGVMKALLYHYNGIDRDEVENCEYFTIEV